jgi:hypothetical protein
MRVLIDFALPMQIWSMIAAAATLAVFASAQAAHRDMPTSVLPVPGVPLSVETIEEYVTKNPDGTSATEINKTKYYRDAAGRMRSETEMRDSAAGMLVWVVLEDPVDGVIAILETEAKIAHRAKFPKPTSPGDWAIGLAPNGLVGVSGKMTRKTEDLGKQSIGGVECAGTRTTTTSDDQPSLIAIDELWMSKELELIGLQKHSGPDGEMTSRIQNVDRSVPDPALFVIPGDYRIRDMDPPGPPQ